MKRKAFTLIELLVVMAIIGILAAIVIVSVGSSRQRSRDARRKADLDTFKKAAEMYALDKGYYPYPNNDTNDYAMCVPDANYPNYVVNWNKIQNDLASFLNSGQLPVDPKVGCKTGAVTYQKGWPVYIYLTNAYNHYTIIPPTKFSITTYLENKKDPDTNSFGDSITLNRTDEMGDNFNAGSNAKGKYKNTFYTAQRAYQAVNGFTEAETFFNYYAVGTSE